MDKKEYYVQSYIKYSQLEYMLNEYAKEKYRLHTIFKMDNRPEEYMIIIEKLK